jgi:hypothetical protein
MGVHRTYHSYQPMGPSFRLHGLVPVLSCARSMANKDEFVAMYKAHSASNMVLDVCVFLTPMIIFRSPKLKKKNLLALAGVFTFGGM